MTRMMNIQRMFKQNLCTFDPYILKFSSNSSDVSTRPTKRSKKSFVNDNHVNNNSEFNVDQQSSQEETNE